MKKSTKKNTHRIYIVFINEEFHFAWKIIKKNQVHVTHFSSIMNSKNNIIKKGNKRKLRPEYKKNINVIIIINRVISSSLMI